ncbi:MAG: c-type cytochrome [Limisphaerales bacterium]
MKNTLSWSAVIALVGSLFLAHTLADEAKPGAELWTAPARAAKKKNPVPADETSVAKGKVLYLKECMSCHGTAGKGDGAAAKDLERKPGDLSSAKLWSQTDGALFWKITEGNKPMPSMREVFSEDDRWTVINYVRTLAPQDGGQIRITHKADEK